MTVKWSVDRISTVNEPKKPDEIEPTITRAKSWIKHLLILFPNHKIDSNLSLIRVIYHYFCPNARLAHPRVTHTCSTRFLGDMGDKEIEIFPVPSDLSKYGILGNASFMRYPRAVAKKTHTVYWSPTCVWLSLNRKFMFVRWFQSTNDPKLHPCS